MSAARTRGELVRSRDELRFEAAYYGVVGVLAIAVVLVRFDWTAADVAAGVLAAAAVCGLAFVLSVRHRLPSGAADPVPAGRTVREGRTRSERPARLMPLLMLMALVAVAAGRTAAGLAAAGGTGLALAAAIGFLTVRRWEGRHGGRAVHDGDRVYRA